LDEIVLFVNLTVKMAHLKRDNSLDNKNHRGNANVSTKTSGTNLCSTE